MTFTYELERADYLAFHRFRVAGSYLPGGSRVWMLHGLALLACGLALLEWHNDRPSVAANLFSAGVIIWLFPRVYWWIVRRRVRKVVNDPRNTRLLGRKTVTLAPEGLRTADPGGKSTCSWGHIIRAARTDDHVFLFLSTVEGIVIPRASLEGTSFEAVWEQATAYLDEYHSSGARPESESAPLATTSDAAAMTFSYRFEQFDWMAANIYAWRHLEGRARRRWLVRVAILCVFLIPVVSTMTCPPVKWDLIAICTEIGVFLFLFYPRILDCIATGQMQRVVADSANAHCLGAMHVALFPDRLEVQGDDFKSSVTWPCVMKAERTDEHIFVYLSTIEAIVIARASLEGASFDDVWATINEYLDASCDSSDELRGE